VQEESLLNILDLQHFAVGHIYLVKKYYKKGQIIICEIIILKPFLYIKKTNRFAIRALGYKL
jgi:hypothetical protein